MLELGVISIMPTLFDTLKQGMTQKGFEQNKVRLRIWNPRDWAQRPYCQVDDTPYGGGPGMLMRYEPLDAAIRFAKSVMPKNTRCIYLSPQGQTVKQAMLNDIAKTQTPLLFLAGRYEGIDERLLETHVDEEWSIGDFVLSGGELAAMVFIDAIVRQIPGVLGHPQSAQNDSFMHSCLDYPQYTKPSVVNGMKVPEVLLKGNHNEIETWRRKQALGRTWQKRPDLLKGLTLTKQEQTLLDAYKQDLVTSHRFEGED